MNASLHLSPLLPLFCTALLVLAGAVIFMTAWRKPAPDFYARALFFAVLALLLLNPVIIHETRQALPRKMVIVMDESPSQKIARRDETAEQILSYIKTSLPNIDPVIIRAGLDPASRKNQDTSLFSALRGSLTGIPSAQVAGTVLITDGQVHDAPEDPGALEKLGPFNVVLTGKKDEFDRKITVTESPKYGLLGQTVIIKVKVDDVGRAPSEPIILNVRQDGKPIGQYTVAPGAGQQYAFKLEHAGQNIIEFSVAGEKGELTEINNTTAVIINGVRDRLRVLLVSGMPHIGERAWRDLLKSDPAIDLVHFNILRSPLTQNDAPTREMSLIAFPVEELFEKKIRDFDLVIFDKYAQYGLLLPQYFLNIASFVKEGGAFLLAMGSDETEESLFQTALADILPIEPTGEKSNIISGAYTPQLTDIGKNHPITGDLQKDKKKWGAWFSQTGIKKIKGQVLMTGAQENPLLVIDKVSDGRVAVLASDNIWMWSKGVNGGGPYTELLRNVAHWLMREPELDEDYIKTAVEGNTITVSERTTAGIPATLSMSRPDGKTEDISLLTPEKGWSTALVDTSQNGIYRFSNGSKTAFAVVGTAASKEFSDVYTTAENLAPLVNKTGGAVIWYSETPNFPPSSLKLKEKIAYNITSAESAPLVPGWLALLVVFGGLVWVWRRESGVQKRPLPVPPAP